MALAQLWFGTRAVRFETPGTTGTQFELLDDNADFATRSLPGGLVSDVTGTEWQQFLAFTGDAAAQAALGIDLADGVQAALAGQVVTTGDLRVGEGVLGHNIADLSGNGRLIDVTGTLDASDDPIAITGLGKANAGSLGAASMEAGATGNRVVFSNDLGFGLINGSGTDSGGTVNASRLNDGDSVNIEIRLGRVLAEASFTVRVLNGGTTQVVLDSDGATIRDTNAGLQGGFVQDASAGELLLGAVADGTKVVIDYLHNAITIGGVAFAGDASAFFAAFAAGGEKMLTLGSVVGNATGWSADDLVLTTKLPNEIAAIGVASTLVGAVAEDGTLAAAGQVDVSDIEANPQAFQAPASLAGTYGDFTFDVATGAWDYLLRNGDANVQALVGGQTVQDSLVVTSFDGTTSATITVDVAGADDAAAIGLPDVASVTEDVGVDGSGNLVAAGMIAISDPDAGQAGFQPGVVGAVGNLGSLTLAADGSYGYAVANALVQSLGQGQSYTDSFTVTALDGTAGMVTFTIDGTNDAALIGDPSATAVTEDSGVNGLGNLVAAGTIAIADADQGEAAFDPSVVGAVGNLGSLTLAADGSYSYVVANAATQYLGAGQSKVDSFTVAALDGTTKDVSFTINGVNDAATIGNPSVASVTEDVGVNGSGNLVAAGTIAIGDADAGQAAFNTATVAAAGNLGSLTLAADGSYSYVVANAATQYLGAGQTKVDSFTVAALDGTSATIEFSVAGIDDGVTIQTDPTSVTATLIRSLATFFSGVATDPISGKFYVNPDYGFPSPTTMQVFNDAAAFEAGGPFTNVTLGTLEFGGGTYFGVRNGDILGRYEDATRSGGSYPLYEGTSLARWDATSGGLEATGSPIPGITGENYTGGFDWGGFSTVNVMQDAADLYVYGRSLTGQSVLSQVNPLTLGVLSSQTFDAGQPGWGFMLDGVLFLSNDYYSDTINLAFDTATGTLVTVSIDLGFGSGYVTSTTYDPDSDALYLANAGGLWKVADISDALFA